MGYYVYMLVLLALMLVGVKFVFCELEGHMAKKRGLLNWYLKLAEPFKYARTRSIIFMCIFCYMIVSTQFIFSIEWLIELIGFVAVGVIFDGISQVVGYYYNKIRFRKNIYKAVAVKDEINKAMTLSDSDLIQQRLTDEGKLPFKDERLDVVANELTNFDKYDLYRVVKPGGYILVNQLGSDNYQELINVFLPFKLHGHWDLESGSKSLSEIGLEIVDGVEEHGYVRFNSLTSFIHFMKRITRVDVTQDRFMNFYGQVLKQIKEKSYFELTTHRFMVVARKKIIK